MRRELGKGRNRNLDSLEINLSNDVFDVAYELEKPT